MRATITSQRLAFQQIGSLLGQYCFSPTGDLWQLNEDRDPKLLAMSYCRNGISIDLDPLNFYAARGPRVYDETLLIQDPLRPDREVRLRATAGDSLPANSEQDRRLIHGNWVTMAAYDFSRDVNYQHIQVWGEKGQFTSGGNGVTRSFYSDRQTISGALAHLKGTVKKDEVNVVNISLGLFARDASDDVVQTISCRDQLGAGIISDLYDLGIPTVVGMMNEDIPAAGTSWPQCLRKTIKVGRSSGNKIGIGRMGLDFYAKATVSQPAGGSNGNSFAAPKVAALYALLGNAFPTATVDQKTAAIVSASSGTRDYQGRIAPIVRKGDTDAAMQYLADIFGDYNGDDALGANALNFEDDKEYGDAYGQERTETFEYQIDFADINDVEIEGQDKSATLTGRRAVELTFTGKNDSFDTGFRIKVNNQIAGFYQHNGFRDGRTVTHILERKWFRDGVNTIEIEPSSRFAVWGVKDIKMKFLPAIELLVGVRDTRQYGYEETPSRKTELRAYFELPNRTLDYALSVTGWDIDESDENAVFINGGFLGNLTKGSSSAYAPQNTFLLPKSLLRGGLNHLEFVQKVPGGDWVGFEDEKWAIKDIEIRVARPDLIIAGLEITDRNIKPSKPFGVLTKVRNIGVANSAPTTLRFYTSMDDTISSK